MLESENGTGEEKALSPMWEFLSEEFDYQRPKRGDILDAEVVRIDKDAIIVDVGAKSEGVVPSKDLEMLDEEVRASIEVGDRVSVYVLRPGGPDGDLIVSVNMARTLEDWQEAERYLEEEKLYEGTVTAHNKGGLIVPFGQIRGFVPASQLVNLGGKQGPQSRMEKLAQMEGEKLQLKVIEVNQNRRRLIFSQRAAMRHLREEQKEKLLEELQEGDIRIGKVSNLCDFGAFVDLGGADGLIHISELSWQRVKHPREVLKVGNEVEVYVLRVDREQKRIGLSLRRLQPDPWTLVDEKFYVGQIVKGTITNVVNFGVFARIDEGIEGLIHISELSDEAFDDPQKIVHEGDVLPLKILSIDTARQRIALSLKQAPTLEELEGREAMAEMVQAEETASEEGPLPMEEIAEEVEEEKVAPEEAPSPKMEEMAKEVEEEEIAPEEVPSPKVEEVAGEVEEEEIAPEEAPSPQMEEMAKEVEEERVAPEEVSSPKMEEVAEEVEEEEIAPEEVPSPKMEEVAEEVEEEEIAPEEAPSPKMEEVAVEVEEEETAPEEVPSPKMEEVAKEVEEAASEETPILEEPMEEEATAEPLAEGLEMVESETQSEPGSKEAEGSEKEEIPHEEG